MRQSPGNSAAALLLLILLLLAVNVSPPPPNVKATAPGRSGTASPRQLRYSIDARRALSRCLALISTGVALMFMLLMSLLIIAIAVAWHFSCGGEAAACQITRSFSWGAGLLGVLCLAMAVLAFAEDWKNSGRRKTPSQSEDERLQ